MAAPIYDFEWDAKKAADNLLKHKVSFELAATVFRDPLALTVYDEEHSDEEERWTTLGCGENGMHLVLVHTFQADEVFAARIRIISARKATKQELRDYQDAPR